LRTVFNIGFTVFWFSQIFQLFATAQIPILLTGKASAQTQSGSSQTGTVSNQIPLSFERAVQLALQNNLTAKLGHERIEEARGRALQSLSGLLPDIFGSASRANKTINIASLGLQPGLFPGLNNTFIGPFNTFDARIFLVQNIFSLNAIRQYQAGRVDLKIADLQDRLAIQQVTAATALAYLQTLRDERSVTAAQANLDLANVLLKLARDQHDAGVATGIDVTRAETRVAQETVRVDQTLTNLQQSRLQLKRVTGLPLGNEYSLTDDLHFLSDAPPAINAALADGQQQRVDLKIAEQQLKQNEYELKAAQAEQYPSLSVAGDYGASGIKPDVVDLPTRSIALNLDVPIFNRGITRSRISIASSRRKQAELQLTDLRAQVEQDIRLAIQTETTTIDQVKAAQQSLQLAERELQMARDRFSAGVADNIEVVNAQTSLALARDAEVRALAEYNTARINLAFSIGRIETFRW
jgi:outer membrane protein TolC